MKPVPKYPRIPYLLAGPPLSSADRLLDSQQREALLAAEVVVEEKLDGANVCICFEGSTPRVASRGGVDAIDRGGILGRVRQWASERVHTLRGALGDEYVLYGEWLLLKHQVAYTRLPSLLIGIDVFDRIAEAFVDVTRRDAVLAHVGVPPPPRIFTGVLGTEDRAQQFPDGSAFGDQDAEGIIIRPVEPGFGTPRIAKLVRPDFKPIPGGITGANENVPFTDR